MSMPYGGGAAAVAAHASSVYASSRLGFHCVHALALLVAVTFLLPLLLPAAAQSDPDNPLFWSWSGNLSQSTAGGQSITITGDYFLLPGECTVVPDVLFTFSDDSSASCTVTSQINTELVCTVPAGFGAPHVTISICGQLNRDLPVVPSQLLYYVGDTPPMELAWCHLWNNSAVAGFTWTSTPNWFCSSDMRQKLSATSLYAPDRPLFTSCAPDWSYAQSPSDPTCNAMAANKRCIDIYDPLNLTAWNFTSPADDVTYPHLFCTETASPYTFVFYPNCTSSTCQSQCVQILNPNAQSPTWTSGNAYLCTTSYPSPFPAPDTELLYHYAAPTILSVFPVSGPTPGGTVLMLTGSSFGFESSTTIALLPSLAPCNITSLNHTYATCILPPGTGTVYLRMSVAGVYNTVLYPFTYNAPVISSVAPQWPNAMGGANLTISGADFGQSGAVSVWNSLGTTIVIGSCAPQFAYNDSTIICAAPPGQGATAEVYVTSSLVVNAVPGLLSYQPPAVQSVSPSSFSTEGGVVLDISGTSFGFAGSVTVGGVACSLTGSGYNNSVIQCILPAGQGSGQAVVVTASSQLCSPCGLFSYSPPSISSVSPEGGEGGTVVTVVGSSFGNGASSSVSIGGLPCVVGPSQWQQRRIICTAQASSGVYLPVLVNVSGQLSNAAIFSYTPVIVNVTTVGGSAPTSGGVTLNVSGVGFSVAAVAPATVYIGSALCGSVSESASWLTCVLPPGSGVVTVVVQLAGLNSTGFAFSYDAPSISSLTPALISTAGGTTVAVYGSDFGLSPTATVDGQSCPIVGAPNNTFLTCTAPSGSGTASLLVSSGDGQSSAPAFFSYYPPTISAFSPVSGSPSGGYELTVWGTNFSSSVNLTSVVLNGLVATPLWQNDTQLVIVMPVCSGSLLVSPLVLVDGQLGSTSLQFSYLGASISSVLPASGTASTAGGDVLQINGTAFGSSGYVLLDTTQLTLISYSDTYITATLPAGQGAVSVMVTAAGVPSLPVVWSYAAPSIASIAPSAIPTTGSTLLTLTGSSFGTSGAVAIGAYVCWTSCPGCSYNSSTVVCRMGAGQGANLSVVVTVSGQVSASQLTFSYAPPAIVSVQPLLGSTAGGAVLTVVGSNFGLSAVITFVAPSASSDSLQCVTSGLGQSHTQIQCLLPAFQGAAVPVFVNVSGQVSAAFSYPYAAPVISSVSPLSAPTAGGVLITMTGTNFGSGSSFGAVDFQLTMAGTAVAFVATYSQTSIVFMAVAGSGSSVLLTLTVAGQSGDNSGLPAFSYESPVVSVVSGCPASSGNGTARCSTTAATVITITGSNFGSNVSAIQVTVDGAACPTLSSPFVPHYEVACSLQPSTAGGFDLPVVVTIDALSASAALLSYAGPVIFPFTLVAAPLSATIIPPIAVPMLSGTGSVLISTAALPFNVSFNGQSFGNDASQVRVVFGPAGGSKPFNCSVYQLYTDADSNSTVTCGVGQGVGVNLTFVVHVGGQATLEGSDSVSYPTPIIVPATLRLLGMSAGSTQVIGYSSFGDTVEFGVQDVGVDVTLLTVRYGRSLPFTQLCTQVSLSAGEDNGNLSCQTGAGSGGGFHFQVQALNALSQPGTDTYTYVQGLSVYQVTGCVDSVATNSTAGCPTAGGTTITISGAYFSPTCRVSIGALPCAAVNVLSTTTLTCSLPAQTGTALSVVVTVGLLSSSTAPLLSYAPATVTQIEGCDASFTSTENCDREGGQLITLTGSDFGLQQLPPTVLIGGRSCSSVAVNSSGAAVTCETPAGTGTQQSVIVLQAGGALTVASNVFLSYEKCGAGYEPDAASDVNCTQCQPGSYASAGMTACASCQPGTYASAAGATACSPCSAGFVAAGVAAATCVACAPGLYSAVGGASACTQCAAGRYAAGLNSTACSACQPGTYSGATGSEVCSACAVGQYADYPGAVQCSNCPLGTFANSSLQGVSACTDCAAGTVASVAGQTSCSLCALGQYAPSNRMAACLSCSSGQFANTTALSACYSCSPGFFSVKMGSLGATSCTACAAGSYSDGAGQGECLACSPGQYNPSVNATSCLSCPPGQYGLSLSQMACVGCPPGAYSSGYGAASCTACPIGSYANSTGATGCSACPPGSVQAQVNQSSCTACPLGSYMDGVGQAVCLPCDPGSYADSHGLTACIPCPPGASCPTATGSGVGPVTYSSCAAGSYSVGSQAICVQCNAGQYQNATGATSCLPCPAGEATLTAGAAQCSPCSPGQYAPGLGSLYCVDCPIGFIAVDDGAVGCSACPVGSYSPVPGSSQCYSCAAGSYAGNEGQDSCLPCAAGTYTNGSQSTSCQLCPVGSYQPFSGQPDCLLCSPGSAQSALGQASCELCPAASFSNILGSAWCEACPAGTASSAVDAIACAPCAAGSYSSATGQLACIGCAPGSYTGSGGSSSCTSCAAGYYAGSGGSTSCLACPQGAFSAVTGSPQCLACDAGSYSSSSGSSACTACSPGTYQSSSGQQNCSVCGLGTYSASLSTQQCLLCPAGTVPANGVVAGASSCSACPAGTFQPTAGGSVCLGCSLGTFTAQSGQLACVDCSPGSYASASNATACSACTAGTAQSQRGASGCNSCLAGLYSNTTQATACSSCSPGSYSSAIGSSVCSLCAAGSYQPLGGQLQSVVCPAGSYSNTAGAVGCAFCPPGSGQSQSGQSSCVQCATGMAQAVSGQTGCLECPLGTAASTTGQSSCASCAAGSFQNQTGQSYCASCSMGSAQPSNGAISCLPCDAGAASPYSGSTSCALCPAGSFSSASGAWSCSVCSPGSVTAVQGSIACSMCSAGSFQSASGQSACSSCGLGTASASTALSAPCPSCSPGSYAGLPGLTSCGRCSVGAFSSVAGASACLSCAAGSYQNATGSTACALCGVGSQQPRVSSTTCIPCTVGTYATTAGLPYCVA